MKMSEVRKNPIPRAPITIKKTGNRKYEYCFIKIIFWHSKVMKNVHSRMKFPLLVLSP